MSRSRKKAIYKDRGHMKDVYWRVHRRVNKQIVKHFFSSTKEPSPHYWVTSYDELYFDTIQKYIDLGMSREDAYYEAVYEHEDDFWLGRMVSNNCREWWETPETIDSKTLVNDYDYSDYTIDCEHRKIKRYFYQDGCSEEWYKDRQKEVKAMRRK